ncbi:MAG: toprim domain-containing protein [Bdellovibrionaceae bacterium]|nr:toprim domain-containing protein [Pseudobdellovibrionaceae bacterium]
MNKYAAAYFHRQLVNAPDTHPVRVYLKKRGITSETIDAMKLGYADESWNNLVDFFSSKSVPLALAEKLGLIRSRNTQGHYDLFRERLIFPIFSAHEDVVGFGGRIINPEHSPKYLNSPESPVFYKGSTFYGLNLTAKHIRAKDSVIVVEGYMDFIALYMAGIDNVVATLGTAMTENHARLLKKYTTRIICMFDGDNAGKIAAERSLKPLFSEGLCPLAVFLPDGLDPDDFIKERGTEKLQNLVNDAPELFMLVVSSWLEDFKYTAHEKMEFMERVSEYMNIISDKSLKALYVKHLAKRLSESEAWVSGQLKPTAKPELAPKAAPAVVETAQSAEVIEAPFVKVRLKGLPKDETYILGAAVNSIELLTKIDQSAVIQEFSSQYLAQLLTMVIERYRQNPNDFDKLAAFVVGRVEDPEELSGLFKFWTLEGAESETLKVIESCIKRVQTRNLKRQSEIIAGQLLDPHNSKTMEKLEQLMNINKHRIQINKSVKGEP